MIGGHLNLAFPDMVSVGIIFKEKITMIDLATIPKTFLDVSEYPCDDQIPFLDRQNINTSSLNQDQLIWRENGVLIKSHFIPEVLIDGYCDYRKSKNMTHLLGFPDSYAYMRVSQVLALACYKPLSDLLANIFGEEMLPHFDLTQWVSTERNWHQDDYLNEAHINSHYAAVWFALDDIDPDCGPFQYVPGSHLLPITRQSKVKAMLNEEERVSTFWPKLSERFLNPIYEDVIKKLQSEPQFFLGAKGDMLVWHGRLLHRGSKPMIPNKIRKSLIVHYTGISKINKEFHEVRRTREGCPYIFHKTLAYNYY